MSEPASAPPEALVDTPPDVRLGVDGLLARAQRAATILRAPATTAAARARAKDELKALRDEAGALWSIL